MNNPTPTPSLRSRRAAIAMFASVAIAAPGFSSPAAAATKTSTLGTFAKLREEWVRDLRAKQLEPILKLYASNAVFLQPTGERIVGVPAIRTLFQTIMATFNSELTLDSQYLETSGDLAYDGGAFQESLTNIATSATMAFKGSYVIIYKRQPNDTWQIVLQVWTGTPPPEINH